MTPAALELWYGPGKIRSFSVGAFTGDTLGGDVYNSRLESIFASHVVTPFLVNVNHCFGNSAWSDAFTSRIRESITDSSILS